MQWEAHPGTSWDIWIYLTAKWTKPSLRHRARCQIVKLKVAFIWAKTKEAKALQGNNSHLTHVMELWARLSHGTRVDHCEMCPPPQSAESTTRQRLKHAEVIQHRGTETLRCAVPNTRAVPDTAFIYSEKFSALHDLPLPTYPCVKQNLHPTLDGSLQSNKYFQYGQTIFFCRAYEKYKLKTWILLVTWQSIILSLCLWHQQGKKNPQRNGRGKKSSYQNVNIWA